MKKIILISFALCLAVPSAFADWISPLSLENEPLHGAAPDSENSPWNIKSAFDAIDFSKATEVEDLETVEALFEDVRDTRSIVDPAHADFIRRTTWLWPNDGCFVRSVHMTKTILEHDGWPVTQLFVFGGSMLAMPEWRDGYEGGLPWNYHVAPVVRVGSTVYVIDPAMDLLQPLELSVWVSRFVRNRASLTGAICSSYTFGPNADCDASQFPSEGEGMTLEQWNTYFMPAEWNNIERRSLNPTDLLGSLPPWASAVSAR